MRSETRALKVGELAIGGGAPVSVQTMCKRDPHDFRACLDQLLDCAQLGCELFRMTVPDIDAAKVLGDVRKQSPIPIVADVHFDYRCALAALEAGADALRINPGNIGGRDKIQAVARAAKARGAVIRVGVNTGSMEKDETPVSSALKAVKLLEDEGFRDIVVSVKDSDPRKTVEIYRALSEQTDCPLHLGVTEAGTAMAGTVRNSVALAILLEEGIGDTIRVSLTDRPEREVEVGLEILSAVGLRPRGPSITSCPTCGRTKVNLVKVAESVDERLKRELRLHPQATIPKVAVMGCAVNGPGEAKGADVALCGGNGDFLLYVKGECVGRVSENDAVERVMEYALHS